MPISSTLGSDTGDDRLIGDDRGEPLPRRRRPEVLTNLEYPDDPFGWGRPTVGGCPDLAGFAICPDAAVVVYVGVADLDRGRRDHLAGELVFGFEARLLSGADPAAVAVVLDRRLNRSCRYARLITGHGLDAELSRWEHGGAATVVGPMRRLWAGRRRWRCPQLIDVADTCPDLADACAGRGLSSAYLGAHTVRGMLTVALACLLLTSHRVLGCSWSALDLDATVAATVGPHLDLYPLGNPSCPPVAAAACSAAARHRSTLALPSSLPAGLRGPKGR
ncbi:hypothetical protein [Nocardia carnea]|uniref:hypothetical protein n=1 Tax=Nocardia carnea TaxID=37328 RepID=UPI0024566452|nr:hypothetical protein [Nocardia carnea]